MQPDSELRIIVPGICGPLAEINSLKNNSVVTDWVKVLSKSQSLPSEENFHDVVNTLFAINTDADLPSAALCLLANDMFDSSLHYMHADPVFLRADMDHAVLTSSTDLDIKEKDSESLCKALNTHFGQDGLTFFKINKDKWFVSSKNKIKLKTTSLVDATGRNINFILPAGDDSLYWKSVLTEAQMLMFSHQANTERENSGLLTINSLWFHGCGGIEGIKVSEINCVCSNDDMLKGLARHIKCDYLNVPDSADEYLDYLLSCNHGTENVLHLSELEHLTNYTDTAIWAEQLRKVLDNWIYPIVIMARKNKIRVTLQPCNGKAYQFSKHDSLKFWRKSLLEDHVNCY